MPEEIISTLLGTEIDFYLVWFWMRIVFLVVSGGLLTMIIYCLSKTNWFNYAFMENAVGFLNYKPLGVGKIVKKWNKIIKRIESGSEDEYKLSILEAEEALDDVLKRLEYKGENLEERLDNLPPNTISNTEELKGVSEIRGKVVYNPDYKLSLDETKRVLDIFNQALRDLQAF